jgi:hypothetical protein
VPIGKDITPSKGKGSLILVNHMYGKTVYLRIGKVRQWQGKITIGLVEDPSQATRFTQARACAGISMANRLINRAFTIERAVAVE